MFVGTKHTQTHQEVKMSVQAQTTKRELFPLRTRLENAQTAADSAQEEFLGLLDSKEYTQEEATLAAEKNDDAVDSLRKAMDAWVGSDELGAYQRFMFPYRSRQLSYELTMTRQRYLNQEVA